MPKFEKPIFIMLPGIDGSGLLLEPLAEKIKDIFDVKIIPYDQKHINEEKVYFEVANKIKSKLPKEKDFFILGESFGGPLVANICADPFFTHRIKGTIFAATFVENPFFTPLTSLFKVINSNISLNCLPDNLVDFIFTSQISADNPTLKELFIKSKQSISDHTLRHRINSVLDLESGKHSDFTSSYFDKTHYYKEKTIILRGTKDLLIPKYNSDLIAKRFQNSKIIDINSSHLLLETKTDEVAQIIKEEFLPSYNQKIKLFNSR